LSPSSSGEVSLISLVFVVLIAPAPIALAAFVVTLTVVATTFLAIDEDLIFGCCVPAARGGPSSPSSLGEGSAMALVALLC